MSTATVSQRISRRTRTKVSLKPEPSDRTSKSLLRELRKLVADKDHRCRNLSTIHRAGQIVRDLLGMEGKSTYRQKWMLVLASRINPKWQQEDRNLRGFLYRAREFAEWPKDEVIRLAGAKRKTGGGNWENLSWEYVWRMLSVREPAKRKDLVERWSKHEFSLRAWDREIQQFHGIRFRGRPPARPETVVEAIRQTEEMARRWKMWFHNNLERAGTAQGLGEWQEAHLEKFPVGLKQLLNQTIKPIEEIREKARSAWRRTMKSQAPSGRTSKSKKGRRTVKAKRRGGRSPKT